MFKFDGADPVRIGVDSGQVMIVDPCYLLNYRDVKQGEPGKPYFDEKMYESISAVTLSGQRFGEAIPNPHMKGANLGFATSSGYGDGFYPVRVIRKLDEPGAIAGLLVDFMGVSSEVSFKE